MILVDTNIVMYAAGARHPNQLPCQQLIDRISSGSIAACVDAEVLQEICHRYRAIRQWERGRIAYDLTRRVFPEVIAITAGTVDLARRLLDSHAGLSARDAIHAAACIDCKAQGICTYDSGFDAIRTLTRMTPADLL